MIHWLIYDRLTHRLPNSNWKTDHPVDNFSSLGRLSCSIPADDMQKHELKFDCQWWSACKFSSQFQWNVSHTGIESEDNYQLMRCDLDVTQNSHDYQTKKPMVLVRRINVSIFGMKGVNTTQISACRLPLNAKQTLLDRDVKIYNAVVGCQRKRKKTTTSVVNARKNSAAREARILATLHNNLVKSPNLKLWRQRERTVVNLSFSLFTRNPPGRSKV